MKLNVGESKIVKIPFWVKGVDVSCGSNCLSLDRQNGCAYLKMGTGTPRNVCATFPLGRVKELNEHGFHVKAQSKTRMLVSVGRALFVIDYAAKKAATNVVGLRAYANGGWGDHVQSPWRAEYLPLFDQPLPPDEMDRGVAQLFWKWFANNELDIIKLLGEGKKEEKEVFRQTNLWLCPVFPYAKSSRINFDLRCREDDRTFLFFHGGSGRLMADAEEFGKMMPEHLARRWKFVIEE